MANSAVILKPEILVCRGFVPKIEISLANYMVRPSTPEEPIPHLEWKFTGEDNGWIRIFDLRAKVLQAYQQQLIDGNKKSFHIAFYQTVPCVGQYCVQGRAPYITLTDITDTEEILTELFMVFGGRYNHDEYRVIKDPKSGRSATHMSTKISFIEKRTHKPYSL